MDTFIHFGLAADRGFMDSGLKFVKESVQSRAMVGSRIGVSLMKKHRRFQKGARRISPFLFKGQL